MERKHSSQPIDQCQGRQTGQVFVATKVAASLDGCSSHLSLAETILYKSSCRQGCGLSDKMIKPPTLPVSLVYVVVAIIGQWIWSDLSNQSSAPPRQPVSRRSLYRTDSSVWSDIQGSLKKPRIIICPVLPAGHFQ